VKKRPAQPIPLVQRPIIYELHVRAFADSNGDGIGTSRLLARLDYLQDSASLHLLLPFFPSPLRDDGYDISNYVDVHPSYGTLNDSSRSLTRTPAQHAGHDRAGYQSLAISTLVQGCTRCSAWLSSTRDVRLVHYGPALQGRPHHLHRLGKVQLDMGRDCQGLLLAPLLSHQPTQLR